MVVGGRPAEGEMDTPPANLDKWAKAAWREVVPHLIAGKLIDRVDRQALEAYCLHVGRARALREEIEWVHEQPRWDEEGQLENAKTVGRRLRHRTLSEQFTAVTARGFTSNPLLSQEREALREARMAGELLGLNPVGRTRLVGKNPKGKGVGLGALTAGLPPLRVVPPEGEEEL
jgi:P27 family predicted phage terminase small subunit